MHYLHPVGDYARIDYFYSREHPAKKVREKETNQRRVLCYVDPADSLLLL